MKVKKFLIVFSAFVFMLATLTTSPAFAQTTTVTKPTTPTVTYSKVAVPVTNRSITGVTPMSGVQLGWYWVPVAYITLSRQQTYQLWDAIWWYAASQGVLCSFAGPAARYCDWYVVYYWHAIYAADQYAVYHYHRCFKMRAPYVGGWAGLFSAYSVNC